MNTMYLPCLTRPRLLSLMLILLLLTLLLLILSYTQTPALSMYWLKDLIVDGLLSDGFLSQMNSLEVLFRGSQGDTGHLRFDIGIQSPEKLLDCVVSIQ